MALEDSLIGVLVGWLLGLASSIYFQDRSLKQQRHETTKERVYSPLYDETEENLDRLRQHFTLASTQWIRITTQDHLAYLIEPPELSERLRHYYRELDSNLNSCIAICSLTYLESVKNDLMSKITAAGTSMTSGATTTQAVKDVANGVGVNLYRGFVHPRDIPNYSRDFDSLKPYSKGLPENFQEYFEEWKVKSEKDEIIVNYRNVHEQAVNESNALLESLGNVLRDSAPKARPQEVTDDHKLRAEERRAVALFGILTVVAAVWAALWGKAQTQQDFFYNFPGNNVAHFTLYVIPFFQYLIVYWVGYAVCMYFYFSDDWFRGSKIWSFFRDLIHGAGQAFEGLYLLTVGYVVFLAGIGFNAPNEVQPIYWLLFPFGLILTVMIVLYSAFGERASLMRVFRAAVRVVRRPRQSLS